MSLFSTSELKTTNKAFVFSHCAYILCFLQAIELDCGHGCLIFYRLLLMVMHVNYGRTRWALLSLFTSSAAIILGLEPWKWAQWFSKWLLHNSKTTCYLRNIYYLTNSSCPSKTLRQAPHSMSHNLSQDTLITIREWLYCLYPEKKV